MKELNEMRRDFFKKIEEMARTQQYDEETVEKLLNIIAVSKMLLKKESNEEVAKVLLNICIVGESLAKKLYAIRDK